MSEKKDAYVAKLKAKLDEWHSQIEAFRTKLDQAEAERKIEFHEQLEKVRARHRELEERLKALEDDNKEAWEELKDDFERAWDSMGEAVESALSRFE